MSGFRLFRVVLCFLALFAAFTTRAVRADGTLIPASSRFDFVHDSARGVVYISSGSQILRWLTADKTFLPPISIGGQVRAIDISPDGTTLAVADAQLMDPPSWARLVFVDLNSLTTRRVAYQVFGGEAGGYGLAYDFNGNILISPALLTATAGPLRLYNAATREVVRISQASGDSYVAGNTVVKANAGRAILGIAETASSDGAWGTYYAASGQLTRFRGPGGTAAGNYPGEKIVDFATDDAQAFLPTTGAMHIRNLNGAWILRYGETNGTPGTAPTGIRRAPNYVAADVANGRLYFSDSNSTQVRIIASSTRAIQGFVDAETTFGNTSGAYGEGALRLANNLSSLLIAVPGGVRFVPLQNGMPLPSAPAGNSLTTPEDTPKSFTLVSPFEAGGTPTYSIIVRPTRGYLYGTAPNLTYAPYSNFNGSDSLTFTASNGTETRTQVFNITVTPVNDAPVAYDGSSTVHAGKTNTVYPAVRDADAQYGVTGPPVPSEVVVVTPPAHGTLAPVSGKTALNYTPDAGYFGSDSFTFKGNDGTVDSNTAAYTINVIAPPVAVDDSFSVPAAASASIAAPGVRANDSVTPGTYSYLSAAQNVSAGTVNLNTNGSFVWNNTPGAALPASGVVTFKYSVSDQYGSSNLATVTLNFASPVVATLQNRAVDEDTPEPITLAATGGNGPLSFAVVRNPAHGTLSGEAPNLIYTPAANYFGLDDFLFRAGDGATTSEALVSLSTRPINDAPVAIPQTLDVDENKSKPVVLNASDVDGDALTWEFTAPTNGVLSGTAPNLTYTPNAGFNGVDEFTFRANDGKAPSASATITLNIAPINDAPVAQSQTVFVDEDAAKEITLGASDAEGDVLTFAVVDEPAHGVLSGDAPNLTYTPAANFSGEDSFTFRASDAALSSAPATVTIRVAPIEDAPVAQSATVLVDEDTPKPFTLNGTDADGDALSFALISNPSQGILSGDAPDLTFTPAANFNGEDSFRFRVSDGKSDAEATVSLSVRAVNDAPVAISQTLAVDEDTPKPLVLGATDVDGDPVSFTLVSDPSHGTLSGEAPNLIYTPAANWSGTDSFAFRVSDGTATSAPATITFNIASAADAPVATPQNVSALEDTPKSVTLAGSDADGDALSFAVVSNPENGTLTGTAPNLVYTPRANWNGSDSFTFTASDASSTSTAATITLTVSPVNDAPVANSQTVAVDEDTPKPLTLGATDVDSDALTWEFTAPSNGVLSGTAPNLIYTPRANSNGADSFTFRVRDGALWSSYATVTLNVAPVNDAPVVRDATHQGREDVGWGFGLLVFASDPDGDVLQPSLLRAPANGTVSFIAAKNGIQATVNYVPKDNWSGEDSFQIAVSDGQLSVPMTVSVRYTPVNDAPFLYGLTTYVAEDGSAPITKYPATDVEGDVVTQSVVTQPANGTLSGDLDAGTLVYRPRANWSGVDSFTIRGNDGALDSNIATVTINVTPVNDAPVANGAELFVDEDATVRATLGGTDIEGDTLSFVVTRAPANGTLSGTSPNLVYAPRANWSGVDSFAFTASDGKATSAPAIVTINVAPINDAPVATPQTVAANEDTPKPITLGGTDAEGNALLFTITRAPASGTLSGTAPNLTYSPAANFNGVDSFAFRASDGTLQSDPATVTIQVAPVNDAPIALPQSVSTNEDIAKTITLTGSSPDGAALVEWAILSSPSQGTLGGGGANRSYAPAPNAFGSTSFTFRVKDARGVWSAPATVSIEVVGVNDAPWFNISNSSFSVRKNSGTTTQSGFIHSTSRGPSNENGQTLTTIVTNSNASLWSNPPAIDANGTLRFTVANARTGTATVTVILKDNGGTANGGVDTSLARTFTITVR